jgi:hypothetical protein
MFLVHVLLSRWDDLIAKMLNPILTYIVERIQVVLIVIKFKY